MPALAGWFRVKTKNGGVVNVNVEHIAEYGKEPEGAAFYRLVGTPHRVYLSDLYPDVHDAVVAACMRVRS